MESSPILNVKEVLKNIQVLLSTKNGVSKIPKDEVLENYSLFKDILGLSKELEDIFRMEIVGRIEKASTPDVKANKLVSDQFEATLERKVTRKFDNEKLVMLAGLLSSKEYDALYEVEIKFKWAALKELQKQGGKPAKVISSAVTEEYGKPSISIKERGEE